MSTSWDGASSGAAEKPARVRRAEAHREALAARASLEIESWALVGCVSDAEEGAPIADAQVRAEIYFSEFRTGDDTPFLDLGEVRSDELGRYRVDLSRLRGHAPWTLRRSTLIVEAWAAEHLGAESGDDAGSGFELWDGERGLCGRIDVALLPGQPLRGRVVSEDGLPVGDAEVVLRDDGEELQDRFWTDRRGCFEIDRDSREITKGAATIVARHPAHGRSAPRVIDLGKGEVLPNLVLVGGGPTLRGTVRCTSGDPLPGTTVEVEPLGEDSDPQGRCEWVGTAEDGAFEIHNLVPGEYGVHLTKDDRDIYTGACWLEEVGIAGETGGGDVDLVLPFGRIALRAFDERGQALADFWITYEVWEGQKASRAEVAFRKGMVWKGKQMLPADRMDRNRLCWGVAYLWGLPGSFLAISIQAPGMAPCELLERMPEVASAKAIDVVLRPLERAPHGAVVLELTDPTGRRIEDYEWRARMSRAGDWLRFDERDGESWNRMSGEYRLAPLPEGRLTLALQPSSSETAREIFFPLTAEVEVRHDEEMPVSLCVESGACIRLDLRQGAPQADESLVVDFNPGVRVQRLDPLGEPEWLEFEDERACHALLAPGRDLRFRTRVLRPGVYSIRFECRANWTGAKEPAESVFEFPHVDLRPGLHPLKIELTRK